MLHFLTTVGSDFWNICLLVVFLQMLNNGLKNILVLEDDVRFESNFRRRLEALLDEAFKIRDRYPWDLM